MNPEIAGMFDRAEELIRELEDEYTRCKKERDITEKLKNITHELIEKLRHILDHATRVAWEKYIAPKLNKEEKGKARVYFPITNKTEGFKSILGRAKMQNLEKVNKVFYDFLLKQQLFSSSKNKWLIQLANLAAEGKHVEFVPQRIKKHHLKTLTTPEGINIILETAGNAKISIGEIIIGDPKGERSYDPSKLSARECSWESIVIKDYDIDVLDFCKGVYAKTRKLVEEMPN
ncbi:MAG: hypothetical protein K8T10_09800 [Candidatus Eremiobacteraeota bacterium]|nr:hypothetical protein [Candidatus Eremiobacteraeota bacterium]